MNAEKNLDGATFKKIKKNIYDCFFPIIYLLGTKAAFLGIQALKIFFVWKNITHFGLMLIYFCFLLGVKPWGIYSLLECKLGWLGPRNWIIDNLKSNDNEIECQLTADSESDNEIGFWFW